MTSSHSLEEHVGEIQLHLEADSAGEIFCEAARALASLLAPERPGTPAASAGESARQPERVTVTSRDRASLLADWLNELIYRAEVRGVVPASVEVELLTDTQLRALVTDASPERLLPAVKAATYHRLLVEPRDGRWHARVVLDS